MIDDDTMTEALRAAGQKLAHDLAIEEYKAGHAERMVAAQARIDENLRLHAEREAREAAWIALIARAAAIGCRLQRCSFDPNCDGECGCSPSLYDREENPVGDLASDEPSQDLAMFTALIEDLESNGGLRR